MDIHLPKALHNWREDLRELVIVIAGVFIALVAQQMLEASEWRHKVAVADAAMRDELLYDDGPQIYQRAAMHPCLAERLDAIRSAVESGGSRQAISGLVGGYWVDFRTFDMLALNAATASDVAAHMRQDRFQNMTDVYETMPLLERTNAQEGTDVARLRAFRRTGGAVSDDEKDRLLSAVEALRNDDQIMWVKARAKLPELRKIGPLDPTRVGTFMADARGHYGDCVKPLPADFPAHVPL